MRSLFHKVFMALPLVTALGILGGCVSEGENVRRAEQGAGGFCDGSGQGPAGLVCGVGDAEGHLAINFNDRWFAVPVDGAAWSVRNNVRGTFAAVPATDLPVERIADVSSCVCQNPTRDGRQDQMPQMEQRVDCQESCATNRPPETRIHRRRFEVGVGSRHYKIEAREVVYDEQFNAPLGSVSANRDFVIEIKTTDAEGGEWTALVTPKRFVRGADQEALNESATDTTPTTGAPGTLVTEANTFYTQEVELGSVVRAGSKGKAEDAIESNPALHASFDHLLQMNPDFQNSVGRDERTGQVVMQSKGEQLSRIAGAGDSTALFDLKRATEIWLDTKKGKSGWSNPGLDRPGMESTERSWRFRRTLVDKTMHFPFLAGICGMEANFNAYVDSGFTTAKTKKCFDGIFGVEANGWIETGAEAGAGFGCNIVVASASAGLSARARARAYFETKIDPTRIYAKTGLYAALSLQAYFKTRVLFWSKRWEATVIDKELWKREFEFDFAPLGAFPDLVCDGGDPDADNSCDDPSASCDLTDRCVRYDFTPNGTERPTPVRVDTGPCNSLVGGRKAGTCFPQSFSIRDKLSGWGAGATGCTGTLISPRHILTAAHCLDQGRTPSQLFVEDPATHAPVNARSMQYYPQYDACDSLNPPPPPGGSRTTGSEAIARDIGIIELESPINSVIPAIVDGTLPVTGDSMTYVGYGFNTNSPTPAPANLGEKRMGVLKMTNQYSVSDGKVLTELYGSRANNRPGDSGGPFFKELGCGGNKSAPTVRLVESAISTNAAGKPISFATPVAQHLDFIRRAQSGEVMPKTVCCPNATHDCTLPGGAKGHRTCDGVGNWAGSCVP